MKQSSMGLALIGLAALMVTGMVLNNHILWLFLNLVVIVGCCGIGFLLLFNKTR